MKALLTVGLTLCGLSSALAEDPIGCDKFKFPLEAERAALTATALPKINSGGEVSSSKAETIELRPLADAAMPKAPERNQKPDTYAGFVKLESLAAGTYTVTVSDYAWVDVLQNGNYLKPKDHSGVKGCAGVRKAMKFDLAAGAATIQLSGVAETTINLAVFRVTK